MPSHQIWNLETVTVRVLLWVPAKQDGMQGTGSISLPQAGVWHPLLSGHEAVVQETVIS